MEYIQLLARTCSDDISSCCGDYGIATFLYVMKRGLTLIQIIAPIILIVMAAISFLQMVINPDDQNKAKSKSMINKFMAAIIVFFIPLIINVLMAAIPDSFEIAGCWKAADDTVTIMNETEDYEAETSKYGKKKYTTSHSQYEIQSNSKAGSGKLTGTITQKRKKVVQYAKKYEGETYTLGGSWDGENPYVSTDSSGFVQGIFRHFGYFLPRTSKEQAIDGSYEKITPAKDDLKKGDLIFYYSGTENTNEIDHVAIYIGGGEVIHASNSKDGVKVSSYNYRTPAWARRIVT